MNNAEANLFRIQLATIKESARELNEIELESAMEKLSLIKSNIAVCEKLLGTEL